MEQISTRHKHCYTNRVSDRFLKDYSKKKINYDQLVFKHLQSSLSGQIFHHVQETKNWLKKNKKEGKNMIKMAQIGLKRTLETKRSLSNQLFCTKKKTLDKVLWDFKKKNQNPKIFDLENLEKIITKQQKQALNEELKAQSRNKIKNYLSLISKLDKKKKEQEKKQNKIQCYDKNLINNFQKDKTRLFKNQYLEMSYKQPSPSSTGLISRQGSRKNSFNGVNSHNSLIVYHPILENNLQILYEPKKKSKNRNNFCLSKGKNGEFV